MTVVFSIHSLLFVVFIDDATVSTDKCADEVASSSSILYIWQVGKWRFESGFEEKMFRDLLHGQWKCFFPLRLQLDENSARAHLSLLSLHLHPLLPPRCLMLFKYTLDEYL